MKRTLRKTLRLAVPVLAFLFQLWRGFRPCGPEPGVIMSGGGPRASGGLDLRSPGRPGGLGRSGAVGLALCEIPEPAV